MLLLKAYMLQYPLPPPLNVPAMFIEICWAGFWQGIHSLQWHIDEVRHYAQVGDDDINLELKKADTEEKLLRAVKKCLRKNQLEVEKRASYSDRFDKLSRELKDAHSETKVALEELQRQRARSKDYSHALSAARAVLSIEALNDPTSPERPLWSHTKDLLTGSHRSASLAASEGSFASPSQCNETVNGISSSRPASTIYGNAIYTSERCSSGRCSSERHSDASVGRFLRQKLPPPSGAESPQPRSPPLLGISPGRSRRNSVSL